MSTSSAVPQKVDIPRNSRIAIVAARFNADIVDELLRGCLARLKTMGIDESRIEVHRVPGAFELPLGAKLLGASKRYSAVVCLGCVIRGATAHFDYVAGNVPAGFSRWRWSCLCP